MLKHILLASAIVVVTNATALGQSGGSSASSASGTDQSGRLGTSQPTPHSTNKPMPNGPPTTGMPSYPSSTHTYPPCGQKGTTNGGTPDTGSANPKCSTTTGTPPPG